MTTIFIVMLVVIFFVVVIGLLTCLDGDIPPIDPLNFIG